MTASSLLAFGLAFLLPVGSLIGNALLALSAIAAIAVVGVVVHLLQRSRAAGMLARQGDDSAAAVSALGDKIETLVGEQRLQGETQRQVLAQKIDGIAQRFDETRALVDGVRNEMRHESRRRDAEMDEMRHQLASLERRAALPPSASAPLALPAAQPPVAEPVAMPEPTAVAEPTPVAPPPALTPVVPPAPVAEVPAVPDLAAPPAPAAAPLPIALVPDTLASGDGQDAPPTWEVSETPLPADDWGLDPDEPSSEDDDPAPAAWAVEEVAFETPPRAAPSPLPAALAADVPAAPAPVADVPAAPTPNWGETDWSTVSWDPDEVSFAAPAAVTPPAPDVQPVATAAPTEVPDAFASLEIAEWGVPAPAPPAPLAEAAPHPAPPPVSPDAAQPEVTFAAVEPIPLPDVAAPAPAPVPVLAFAPAEMTPDELMPAAPAPTAPSPEATVWVARAAAPAAAAPAADAPAAAAPFVAPEGADDLTVITSIDDDVQRALYMAGVTSLDEIARWSRTQARHVSGQVGVSEDLIANQWVFEAQAALFDRYAQQAR